MLFMDGIDSFYAQLPRGAAPALRPRCPSRTGPCGPTLRCSAPRLGYSEATSAPARDGRGAQLEKPVDIRRVIDNYGYLDDWRANYRIQSVRVVAAQHAHHLHRRRDPVLRPARAALPGVEAAPARHPPARSEEGRGVRSLRRALLGRRRQGRVVLQVQLHRPGAPGGRCSTTRRPSRRATRAAYVAMGFAAPLLRGHDARAGGAGSRLALPRRRPERRSRTGCRPRTSYGFVVE